MRFRPIAIMAAIAASLVSSASVSAGPASFNQPKHYYLALGDSLAFGYQQAKFNAEAAAGGVDATTFNTGYVDDFGAKLRAEIIHVSGIERGGIDTSGRCLRVELRLLITERQRITQRQVIVLWLIEARGSSADRRRADERRRDRRHDGNGAKPHDSLLYLRARLGLSTTTPPSQPRLRESETGVGVERRRIGPSPIPLDQGGGPDHRRIVGAEIRCRNHQVRSRAQSLLRRLP